MCYLQDVLIQFPKQSLTWLNSWPAGLKLNTELSQFYCHSLLGVVAVWGGEILTGVPKSFLTVYQESWKRSFFLICQVSCTLSEY